MKVFETPGLFGSARNLEPARSGVLDRGGGLRLGRAQPSLRKPQRVPAKAQSVQADQHRSQNTGHDQPPAPGSQGSQDRRPPHGNTLRSSSKCGPSLRVVQSPPQIMAVP